MMKSLGKVKARRKKKPSKMLLSGWLNTPENFSGNVLIRVVSNE
jgi:hypothetical protein